MTPTIPKCQLDFLSDLARLCDSWLVADGFALSEANLGAPMGRLEINTLYRYFNLHRRRPSAVPRRVHRSRELSYPSNVATGIAQVEHELLTGIDLWPRLSRRLPKVQQNNDPRKNDHLLADWDIYHLHLGVDSDRVPSGQIRGDKFVLFCILDPEDAYLIQVLDHDAFSEPALLEIVYANWSQLMMPLALYPGAPPAKAKIREARESGVVALTTLANGFVPAPRGGGYTTSGHSLRALRLATQWADVTSQWEDCARQSLSALLDAARGRRAVIPEAIRVELDFDDGRWWAVYWEIESRLELPEPPPDLTMPLEHVRGAK